MLIRESAWLRESMNTCKTHCLQPQLGIYYKTTLIRMVHSGLGNRTDRKFKTQGGAIQGFWFTVALIEEGGQKNLDWYHENKNGHDSQREREREREHLKILMVRLREIILIVLTIIFV